MRKGVLLIIFVLMLVVAGCGSGGNDSNLNRTTEEGERTGVEIAKLEDITLLGDDEKEGFFHEVVVQMSDQSHSFMWRTSSNPTYYPTVEKIDMNGDGTDEIVIMTTRETGSDINVQELHVLESKGLTELQVEDPLTYVNQNIKSTITKSDGLVNVHVQTNSQQEIEKVFKEEDAGMWFDEVSYVNHIKYEIKNNSIVAILLGTASPSLVVVAVEVEYDENLRVRDLLITEVNN